MNNISKMLILLSLLFAQSISTAQSESNPSIYVWDFSDRDGKTNELTMSFTDEFEEAILQSDCCTVLQRRYYSRLFQQMKNEQAIKTLNGVSSKIKDNLGSIEANTVAFGEIYDDLNSGQVKLSVSFENFNGEILKKASVYMNKYDINNPKKREDAVQEVIDELQLAANKKPLIVEEVDEWTFALTGCQKIGKDIKCGYIVTSNYRDRNFRINAHTTAFDEYGYQYELGEQGIANKTSRSYIKTLLIDGVPTSGFVTFKNVSSRATKFTLIKFAVKGDDLSQQEFQFRDVVFD